MPGHLREQLGMRRRVGLVQIVHGMDEAAPQEVFPQPVHGGLGEVRIVGAGDPLRQQFALVGRFIPVGGRTVEKRRLHDHFGLGNQNRVGAAAGRLGGRHAAGSVKERCQRPKLLPRPVRKRMIVALGTLHLHAQENTGRAGRDHLGLLLVGLKKGHGAGDEAAHAGTAGLRRFDRRGQELGDQPIVRHVHGESQPEPGFQLGRVDLRFDVFGRAGQHQPAPRVGKVLRMRAAPQQRVDQPLALVALAIGQKALDFGHRGNLADHIEIRAAQKLGVIGRRRGRHAVALPGRGQRTIDQFGQFVGRQQRGLFAGGRLARRLIRPGGGTAEREQTNS